MKQKKKLNMRTNDRRSVSISVQFIFWIDIMGVYQVALMLMLLLGIFSNLCIWFMSNIVALINYEFENLLTQMEFLWPLNMKTAWELHWLHCCCAAGLDEKVQRLISWDLLNVSQPSQITTLVVTAIPLQWHWPLGFHPTCSLWTTAYIHYLHSYTDVLVRRFVIIITAGCLPSYVISRCPADTLNAFRVRSFSTLVCEFALISRSSV